MAEAEAEALAEAEAEALAEAEAEAAAGAMVVGVVVASQPRQQRNSRRLYPTRSYATHRRHQCRCCPKAICP